MGVFQIKLISGPAAVLAAVKACLAELRNYEEENFSFFVRESGKEENVLEVQSDGVDDSLLMYLLYHLRQELLQRGMAPFCLRAEGFTESGFGDYVAFRFEIGSELVRRKKYGYRLDTSNFSEDEKYDIEDEALEEANIFVDSCAWSPVDGICGDEELRTEISGILDLYGV